MVERESEIKPDGRSLGLPAYLVWLGNQLTATAVGAYATLGVGFLEARILVAVGRHPGLVSATLVQHLGVDRAAVSRALHQLRGSGMIVPDDQRRLSLTDTGWLKYAQVAGISDERLARLTAGFTQPELDHLMCLLQRLHQNVPDLFVFNGILATATGRARSPTRTALQRVQKPSNDI
jgi:DNA-binding MarR family transcriptional regulator